ncbi:MAG: ATP-dependent zinc protease family protein [Xanthomonadaceae bacterium]|nr:ATP-dependent zinc protease family protein [Xanthomonadaceae bacterium]
MIELGWREWLSLPELGVARLRAKIDTGARSSALHVDRHWRFHDGGAPWVGFQLTPGKTGTLPIEASARIADERAVVDSGGHRCQRIFVRTLLQIAGAQRDIEINLCDRRDMRFPMLLGRTALEGMFTVDPSCSFLHNRPPRHLEQRA